MSHQLKIELYNWLTQRKITIEELYEFAKKLDEIQSNFDRTKAVGKSKAIIGSVATAVTLLAAPFTAGASLVALGVAGGGLCLGSTIGQHFNEHEMVEKVKKVVDADYEQSMKLKNLLDGLYVDHKTPPETPSFLNYPTCNLALNTGLNSAMHVSQVFKLTVSKGIRKGFGFAVIITLPQELQDCEETIRSIYNGSKNDLAKKVRVISEQLKNEMKENEEFVRQEIAKLQPSSPN